jgi:hypothetical protein
MEWKFNGRRVPPGQLGNVVAKSFAEAAVEQAKAAVARIPCPVHSTGAKNIDVTRNGNHLHFTYEACCDRLKEAINSAAA